MSFPRYSAIINLVLPKPPSEWTFWAYGQKPRYIAHWNHGGSTGKSKRKTKIKITETVGASIPLQIGITEYEPDYPIIFNKFRSPYRRKLISRWRRQPYLWSF